ncbi:MAG: hypothetical protein JEZ07_06275 [Phycisphaerae bacterium]|nr:hypothetical protein [Phycisphaerae bacterium]
MKPDGIIYIETPNYNSIHRKMWGYLWSNANIRDHLTLPSARPLSLLLQKQGFEVKYRSTFENYWEIFFSTIFTILSVRQIKRYCQPQKIVAIESGNNETAKNKSSLRSYLSQELPATIASWLAWLTWLPRKIICKLGMGYELSIVARRKVD